MQGDAHKATRKAAFTLAEVLITLGIIGVVAALTLPAVINNVQNKQLETAFKKSYSSLSQAVQRVIWDEYDGQVPDGDLIYLGYYSKYLNAEICTGKENAACPPNSSDVGGACNFMNKSYKDFSGKRAAACLGNDYVLNIADGATFYFDSANAYEPLYGKQVVVIDVNGWRKRPNKLGHDMFLFQINKDGKVIPGGDAASYFPKENYCSPSIVLDTNGYGCTSKAISEPDYFKKLPH